MRIPRSNLVLSGLLLIAAIGHADSPAPGAYTEGPGLRFFELLRSGSTYYGPTTFDETVETSSVIARGNVTDVIPGRSIGLAANSASPPMPSVFLKIRPTKLLKGHREDYFLVEVPARHEKVSELREQLYTGDLLFLLQPASNMFREPRISVSTEARAEWAIGKSLYMLTMDSTLFTVTGSGNLASPIDVSRDFHDLYSNMQSLEELEARILSILGGQPVQDTQTERGSREWYENIDQDDGPQGLVQQWYESGQLRSEINYYNGEMEGPARYWYESGALQAESDYRNGDAEGLSRRWFENGQLTMEATYQDGQRVECRAWTQEGSPVECR